MKHEEMKRGVISFLRCCARYTEASIQRKISRGEKETINAWKNYLEFTNHSIAELEAGELDEWFNHLEDKEWIPLPKNKTN